jgi:hypothetical protein
MEKRRLFLVLTGLAVVVAPSFLGQPREQWISAPGYDRDMEDKIRAVEAELKVAHNEAIEAERAGRKALRGDQPLWEDLFEDLLWRAERQWRKFP